MKRGTCKFAGVTPDKAGRVIMRKDRVYPCMAPEPDLPTLPACITKAYGFYWPPRRQRVEKNDCDKCPCWTPREEAGK